MGGRGASRLAPRLNPFFMPVDKDHVRKTGKTLWRFWGVAYGSGSGCLEGGRGARAMEGLIKILRSIDNINEWTGKQFSIISIALMLVVVYDVLMRLIGHATLWGVEFSGFLLLALTYLAGGYALLHDAHVNVDIIYKLLPPRIKALMDSLTYLVFFMVPIILVWIGGLVAWQSLRDNTLSPSAWGPPMWPSQMLVPIGGLLIGLQALARWIRSVHILLRGREIESPRANSS